MSRVLFTGVVSLITIFAADCALAADLPQPMPAPQAPVAYVPTTAPAYNWGGWYVGINGGWGFGSGNATATYTGFGVASATGSGNFSGGVAGGQIGANFQYDALVLGIEGDMDWSGQSRTDSYGCGVGCVINETAKIPWMATLRGRVGYALDRVLFYGTAGVAFTNVSDNVNATGVGTLFNASSTDVGWTAGAGVEAALAQNWTARIEYLYVQTNTTLSGPLAIVGGTISESVKLQDSIIRAGINFKYP